MKGKSTPRFAKVCQNLTSLFRKVIEIEIKMQVFLLLNFKQRNTKEEQKEQD